MITTQEFITAHEITATATQADSNPNMSDMPEGSRHWSVLLSRADTDTKMIVKFSQGPAHTEPPTATDVLDCLASDAASWENAPNFDVWASEYGYDTDSRKAKRTFNAVKKQSQKLKAFLSPDQYNDLLWETERE